MDRHIRSWAAFAGLALVAAPADAQWLDKFDTYSPGPLTPQSNWEPWDLDPSVDADVVNTRSFTPGNSLFVDKTDDVIYDFVNMSGGRPTSGRWIFSIKVYVPSTATGTGYVIMLNDYTHNGPKNWSLQTRFNANLGQVLNDGPNGGTATLVYDQWVSFIVCIDLDIDRVDVYYGNENIVRNGTWKDGVSGGGTTTIAVLDLYGGNAGSGITEMYFDNPRIEVGLTPCLILTSRPNPIQMGQTITMTSVGPNVPAGSQGVLFVWSVNDAPFFQPIITLPYQGFGTNRKWEFMATVPGGLSGIQAGFKVIASLGGNIHFTNEDVVVFQ